MEPEGGVDVQKHIFEAAVHSDDELMAYCEAVMMKPLRNGPGAPLWEVHAVTNTAAGCRSMLFFRVEHAVGDAVELPGHTPPSLRRGR